MPFLPGSPKPAASGRKAGTPNRATAQAQQIAEELGVDPFRVLLLLADNNTKALGMKAYTDGNGRRREPHVPTEVRCQAAVAATRHLYPTLKQQDINASFSGSWQDAATAEFMAMTPEEQAAHVAEMNARRAELDAILGPD